MLDFVKEISKVPRVAGTAQCNKVRDLIAKKLKALGFEVSLQEVPFTGWKVLKKPVLKLNGKKVKVLPVIWSGSTKGVLKGRLLKAGKTKTFEAYQWIRYKIVDSENKAKGFVITRPDMVWLQLVDKKSKLPYFMIYPETYRKIKELKGVKVEASVKSEFLKSQKIYNIITRNDSKKRVLVSCHYDSMLYAPGANDNATGVSAALELAKKFKNAQFAFFSAEEFNKFGSYAFVKKLSKKELKKIRFVLNLDMFGSGKPYCICSEKLAKKVKKLLPKPVHLMTKPGPPFDYWPFFKKGVQIVHFGASPYNYCHTPQDTIGKIRLKPMKQVLGYAEKILEKFLV